MYTPPFFYTPESGDVDEVLRPVRVHEHAAEPRVARRRHLERAPDLVILVGPRILPLEHLDGLECVHYIVVDVGAVHPGAATGRAAVACIYSSYVGGWSRAGLKGWNVRAPLSDGDICA